MSNWYLIQIIISFVILIVAGCSPSASQSSDESNLESVLPLNVSGTPDEICQSVEPAEPETRQFQRAEQILVPDTDYRAIFCTEEGAIYADLFENFTPLTVNNFIFLSLQNYYDNTTFHRVLEDFMAQGGDPTGTGTGSPGYRFEDEFVGFLHFDRPGLLAMANGGPATNGSQFFITTSTPDNLNYRHTIFGEILEGQDVVENLRIRDPQTNPAFDGSRLNTVVIITEPENVDAPVERPSPARIEDIVTAFQARPVIPGLETFEVLEAGQFDDPQIDRAEIVTQIRHRSTLCDTTQVPFVETGLRLVTFESASDASTNFNADILAEMLVIGDGSEATPQRLDSDILDNDILTIGFEACDQEMIKGITYWQRGRFIIVVDIAILPEQSEVIDLWLQQVVGWAIYENMFSDILRTEIRRQEQ